MPNPNGNPQTPIFCNFFLLWFFLTACASSGPPPPSANLPPSATDLDILGSLKLCQSKERAERDLKGFSVERTPWGSGEEFHFQVNNPRNQMQWLFFNDDDILIGAVFRFPGGIDLKPYSVLRDTLSQLPPSIEFYGDATNLLQGSEPATVRLYRTGDQKTTTQYIVRDKPGEDYADLLVTVVVIDPYESLLQGTHPKFLAISPAKEPAGSHKSGSQNQSTPDSFLAKQQFARGESAHFGSCPGQANQTDIAIDAYRRAIQIGIKDENRLAEAHHRLGLDLRNKGQLTEAKQEIEHSLKIRPLAPHVLNSLGTLLVQMDKPSEAIVPLEKAIILKPNYALARYNLAGAYETVNRQRAIEQYETYLSLVEDIPEESTRATLAKDRLNKLKQ
jgi:tetratricopeptide (TPR) repeat protein